MMRKSLAMILAGGYGDRLSILSQERAKPAVPFAGRYRIIDFSLSNCVNSGIYNVAVLAQYRPRSLSEHIGIGKPWDLDRMGGGVRILQPYLGGREAEWYKGTADAVYQNLYLLEEMRVDDVVILAGDHVYRMSYADMLAFHRYKQADAIVAVIEVQPEEASRYGIITLNEEDRVVEFVEKPAEPKANLASMGIYVFNKDVLIQRLEADAKGKSTHDFGRDIIPAMIGKYNVFGYRFQGYWRDVGTIDAYWQANMDLLADLPEFNLYDPDSPIYTRSEDKPPVKIGPNGHLGRSLISNGCIINGHVWNSVLSPGVYVEENAIVNNSIIFNDTFISHHAAIERSIIDKEAWIGPEVQIGFGYDYQPNREEPQYLYSGINLVGKRARIPECTKIGRNCIIGPGVTDLDFPGCFVPSGEKVVHK